MINIRIVSKPRLAQHIIEITTLNNYLMGFFGNICFYDNPTDMKTITVRRPWVD